MVDMVINEVVAPQKTKRIKSPAAFAEQYLVESIWTGRFAIDSILPAERELAERIGVTRTTLREVLQRMARDGWLTIQHGKPTRVNDYWQSSGLNILENIAQLDESGPLTIINHLLEARTSIGAIYARKAIRRSSETILAMLSNLPELNDSVEDYLQFDWKLHHGLTLASNNPVYTLILNGFKGLYHQVGRFYFQQASARALAREFYEDLFILTKAGDFEQASALFKRYGHESRNIWLEICQDMPAINLSK